MPRRAGEHAVVVVERGGDPADPGDGQEEGDDDVPGGRAGEPRVAPAVGDVERVGGEREEDHADADADGGEHVFGHVGVRSGCGGERASRRQGALEHGPVRLDLQELVVLAADAVVGPAVALHVAPARERAKT